MNYYKYLDLDWKPSSKKLLNYINIVDPEIISRAKKQGSWQKVNTLEILQNIPELIRMVNSINASIRYIAFFISETRNGHIHIDADTYSKCRINIPILNCENTETRFFQYTGPRELITQNDGTPLYKLDTSKCLHVDQFYLTKAVLFRNTEPHQVVSNNPISPRISCTIGLWEDLSYLLE